MLPEGVQRHAEFNGFQELTSPIEGLLSFRSASTAFRNDYLVNLLSDLFNEQGATGAEARPFFASATFELPAGDRNSLSFSLTNAELQRIDAGIRDAQVEAQLARLTRWWLG
jgi:hypothetical protein